MAFAFHGSGQIGIAELPGAFAGQLFAVLLEGDGRRAAALVGRDGEGPFAGDVGALRQQRPEASKATAQAAGKCVENESSYVYPCVAAYGRPKARSTFPGFPLHCPYPEFV